MAVAAAAAAPRVRLGRRVEALRAAALLPTAAVAETLQRNSKHQGLTVAVPGKLQLQPPHRRRR